MMKINNNNDDFFVRFLTNKFHKPKRKIMCRQPKITKNKIQVKFL